MKGSASRWLASTMLVVCGSSFAHAQSTAPVAGNAPAAADSDAGGGIEDIIVTAQKRDQSINDVGMAITAQSGDQLLEQGVRSVADLAKVVPGFTFEGAAGNAPIYSIRGVGFHDISLASGQTVAVYADETPIPFGFETLGVDFDVERVEVLKGPQGTLFGQNSTGGAINYVMGKPTAEFKAGIDFTYGRFATTDINGFASGPLSENLRVRIAARSIQGNGWQRRYGPVPEGTPRSSDAVGKLNQLAARVLLEWTPTSDLKLLLNVNTRRDRSDTQVPQYINARPSSQLPLLPGIASFPYAPEDNRAAAWDPGVDYAQNNRWKEAALRIEYDAGPATVTSISSYQKYRRFAPARDFDATSFTSMRFGYFGDVETFYQELRASGTIRGQGNWTVGGNYERDNTAEQYFSFNPGATSRVLFGLPNRQSLSTSDSKINTYGIFANLEYPLTDTVTAQAAARYTKADRTAVGCSRDSGNGDFAAIINRLQGIFIATGAKKTPLVTVLPGECITLDAQVNPTLFTGKLAEDNVSWRAGVNWSAIPGTLLYATVSKGYKSGSYPLVAAISTSQFLPVKQESLLAYEAGFKSRLDRTLQLNASAYYYDYTDKQINGTYIDLLLGRLTRLVTIPESRVYGFEATMDWRPFAGFTLAPGVSYVNSKILGTFVNLTPLGTTQSFAGEPFPYAPRWQANVSSEYRWDTGSGLTAFVGGNVSHQSATNGAFGRIPTYNIKGYTLVDLRAGIEAKGGDYRFFFWGTNVFNTYYWQMAARNFDSDVRATGQPARYGVTLSYRY